MCSRCLVVALSLCIASSARADPLDAPPPLSPAPAFIPIDAPPPLSPAPAFIPIDAAPPIPAGPSRVPEWALAMRFPWDVAHADSSTLIAMLGLGLDLDARVTDHTTLGFTTEASLVLALESNGEPGEAAPIARLRAGVDARWIFHDGASLVVPHCGPAFEVPSRAWLGARAGFETLDEGATSGHFAELSIGWERLAGRVGIGPYLAIGVENEPAAAYPVPSHPFAEPSPYPSPSPSPFASPTPLTDPQQSAYITLGLRIGGA